MAAAIEFYFDFSCPYAYLGSTQIESVVAAANAELIWRPMLLGGVFKAVGTPQVMAAGMPAAKARHNAWDMSRWAAHWNVPLSMPAGHPIRTVRALRALLSLPEDRRAAAIHSLYRAYWVDNDRIDDADVIDRAHAIEVYNHGSHVENDRGYGWGLCDILLNQGWRLTGFASDDAHHVTHDAFGGWIQVWAERLDPDLILESLKAGCYYSSQGPEIHDIRFEDDEIHVACSPVAVISAQGKGSRAKYVKGDGMTEGRLPLKRFKDAHIRITVRDAQGRHAWSNPVWLAA